MGSQSTPSSRLRQWLSRYWILAFIALVGGGYLFTPIFLFEIFRVPSRAMEPTLTEGTLFVAAKWGYGNYRYFGIRVSHRPLTASVKRGDLLLFYPAHDPGTIYVKRVIGLPGDQVVLVDDRLTLNGAAAPLRLVKPYGAAQVFEEQLDAVSYSVLLLGPRFQRDFQGTVPAAHYFMLGDSRDNSRDSRDREVGYVSDDAIVGRVAAILYRPDMED